MVVTSACVHARAKRDSGSSYTKVSALSMASTKGSSSTGLVDRDALAELLGDRDILLVFLHSRLRIFAEKQGEDRLLHSCNFQIH